MNIFVSGLNYSLTSDELAQLFSEFGQVSSAKVVTDRESGRSRGFGFVEMSSDDEANNAINSLNQKEVKGRVISVKQAEDRPKKSFSSPSRPRGDFKPRYNRDDRY